MNIKRFEFNMFPVNCYVLWDDTKEAVVIDASAGHGVTGAARPERSLQAGFSRIGP